MNVSNREPVRTVVLGRPEWPDRLDPGADPRETGPTRDVEVAIIGAGPSGLIAAYRLRDLDTVLLEHEPEVGGNARADTWRGIVYPAGAILTYAASPAMELYDELGLEPEPVKQAVRATVLAEGRRLEGDLWGSVIEEIYPPGAARDIRKAGRDLLALDAETHRDELDRLCLTDLLYRYGPEVKHWLNRLLSWFGCTADDISAYAGIYLCRSQMGEGLGILYPERTSEGGAFSFPGGLSRPALALRDAFEAAGRGRTWTDTTVTRVTERDGRVVVRAVRSGHPVTVRARAVIVATSKHVARRIIDGIPADRRAAMDSMTYVPYLVGAVGSREPLASDIDVARTLDAPMATVRAVGSGDGAHLLRCEFPLRPGELPFSLDEQSLRRFGEGVAFHLDRLFPGARRNIEEIRIWRRGYNWYIPVPGLITRYQPLAARPLGAILFANADSVGPISEFGWALIAADAAAEATRGRLAREGRRRRPRASQVVNHGRTE